MEIFTWGTSSEAEAAAEAVALAEAAPFESLTMAVMVTGTPELDEAELYEGGEITGKSFKTTASEAAAASLWAGLDRGLGGMFMSLSL